MAADRPRVSARPRWEVERDRGSIESHERVDSSPLAAPCGRPRTPKKIPVNDGEDGGSYGPRTYNLLIKIRVCDAVNSESASWTWIPHIVLGGLVGCDPLTADELLPWHGSGPLAALRPAHCGVSRHREHGLINRAPALGPASPSPAIDRRRQCGWAQGCRRHQAQRNLRFHR